MDIINLKHIISTNYLSYTYNILIRITSLFCMFFLLILGLFHFLLNAYNPLFLIQLEWIKYIDPIMVILIFYSFLLIYKVCGNRTFNNKLYSNILIFLAIIILFWDSVKINSDINFFSLNIFSYYLIIILGFIVLNINNLFYNFNLIINNIQGTLSNSNGNITRKKSSFFTEYSTKTHIIRRFFLKMSKHGYKYLLALLLIIILFTAIKYPYFDNTFTGVNSMKYNSYVEPAKYMKENNNLFYNQKKYLAEPLENPQGIFNEFGTLPLMEWGLFLTYKILPNVSIEFSTRIFTNFLGISILLLAYVFFSKLFLKKHALLITFLFSINQIFIFSTFLTVYDSILFIFFFLSLIYLVNFIKQNKYSLLYFSGILAGIGVVCKFSLFLFLIPTIFSFLFIYKNKLTDFFTNIIIFSALSTLPLFTQQLSIKFLPTKPILGLFFLSIWIIFYFIIYYNFNKIYKLTNRAVIYLSRHKFVLLVIVIFIILFSFIFLKLTNLLNFSNEFLTDHKLILNFDMYKYMLINQFRPYMNNYIFYLGLMGLFIIFTKNKNIYKNTILSFLAGALIYWIIASKVIFFHRYYSLMIITLFIISASCVIIIMYDFIIKRLNKFIFITIILGVVFIFSYPQSVSLISRQENGYQKTVQYLIDNMKENELFIRQGDANILAIKSGFAVANFNNKSAINNSINEIGFAKTMAKNNIKYLITDANDINYYSFVNLISPIIEPQNNNSYRRSDQILAQLNPDYDFLENKILYDEAINKFNIKNKFILEKTIGNYKIYTFQD